MNIKSLLRDCSKKDNKYLGKINCAFVIASGTLAKRLPKGDSETTHSPQRCGSSQHFEIAMS